MTGQYDEETARYFELVAETEREERSLPLFKYTSITVASFSGFVGALGSTSNYVVAAAFFGAAVTSILFGVIIDRERELSARTSEKLELELRLRDQLPTFKP